MKNLLVVDDEVLIVAELKEHLERMHFNVAGIAHSGEEAVEQAGRLKPDLVLLDIMLGEGRMDGIEAAEIIRERFDIPVIFITAYGNEQIINRAKTVDPLGFISKPFFEDELKACIELALYKVERDRTLRNSEERYRSVVVSAVEAIIIADIRMRIVFWNRAAAGMFGYTAEEIEQRPVLDLISEPQRKALSVEMDRMVLTEEKDTSGRTAETVGFRKDGSEFPMEFSLSSWVVRDDIFFTINARDITDRKKVDQMKTDFVSLVSHQLKTPVAGVLGCIDNLLSGIAGPITPEQREYLLLMRDISLRNYRNVNDLLNVSRIERGVVEANVKRWNLKRILAQVLRDNRSVFREKGLALKIEGGGRRYEALADRDKLYEAFSNILHNALKFTEYGGITVRLLPGDGHCRIEFEDTGPGIPADLQKRLFTRNMVLHGAPDPKRGSGLGLFIAREFMTLQGGDLNATSSPERGSCFRFTIPLAGDKRTETTDGR
jgi:PAS domain S-box-containing protein